MKPNELREALVHAVMHAQAVRTNDARFNAVEKILDAVIASLPEQLHDPVHMLDDEERGYATAVKDVRELLQSAKSKEDTPNE